MNNSPINKPSLSNETLWTIDEVLSATNGQLITAPAGYSDTDLSPLHFTGISTDSRSIENGDLFIPIKGPHFDGNHYIDTAFKNGATGALISTDFYHHKQKAIKDTDLHNDKSLICVTDGLEALQAMAHHARTHSQADFIGITGSVGKTSVKEALVHMLKTQDQTFATIGNLNNDIGLPLSMVRMPKSCRYGIFEMGMSAAGEIKFLSQITRPRVSIITNIFPVHIEFFDDIFSIADAKAEIAEGMDEDGDLILHRESAHFPYLFGKLSHKLNILSFGFHPDADARVIDWHLDQGSSILRANILGSTIKSKLPHLGRHWVLAALAGLLAIKRMGGNIQDSVDKLSAMPPIAGRNELVELILKTGEKIKLMDQSYNASPQSMKAMIELLALQPIHNEGRRILVIGDMLELGELSSVFHEKLHRPILESNIDLVMMSGTNMQHLAQRLKGKVENYHSAHSGDSLKLLLPQIKDGDVIAVKGSLGSAMKAVIDGLISTSQILRVRRGLS